ncbi:hypothetical protein Pcinc_041871 [Petrolisthes cinctipes]|uniref:Uncharacterized protein n=1 Tax=Petrolisthes cinctipes TaxID=88211 RepID=A0AAE1EJD7_PETCI|nr:hypothetical protein Pcinc_041871 [Petrolisthes cinctipes]
MLTPISGHSLSVVRSSPGPASLPAVPCHTVLPSIHRSLFTCRPVTACYITLPTLQSSHLCPSLHPAAQTVIRYTFPQDPAIRYTLLPLSSVLTRHTGHQYTYLYIPCSHFFCHPLPAPSFRHCLSTLPPTTACYPCRYNLTLPYPTIRGQGKIKGWQGEDRLGNIIRVVVG